MNSALNSSVIYLADLNRKHGELLIEEILETLKKKNRKTFTKQSYSISPLIQLIRSYDTCCYEAAN